MALTGTGTQQDPWIAQNYSDIRDAYDQVALTTGTHYLELAQNIDCNDYGVTFKWEEMQTSNNSAMIFDLKGHTIKNVLVASGAFMFKFSGSFPSEIKNGLILNVFLNEAKGVNSYLSGVYTASQLKNMSISVNITGSDSVIFDIGIDSCAIYVEGSNNNYIFHTQTNVGGKCKFSDIELAVDNCTAVFSSGDLDSVSDCRIRGKANVRENDLSNGYPNFESCVFDLETNAENASANSGSATGVINRDKVPSNFNSRGLTMVTSQEIINGNELREAGFVVVNKEV